MWYSVEVDRRVVTYGATQKNAEEVRAEMQKRYRFSIIGAVERIA